MTFLSPTGKSLTGLRDPVFIDAMTSGIVRDVAVTVITVIPCWIIKVGILAVVHLL